MAGRLEKGAQEAPVLLARGRQRAAFGGDVLPRAREELAAGGIGLPQQLGDLGMAEVTTLMR
jgi:hypothetical protein